MTTILRMQPTWGKKKKFLSMNSTFPPSSQSMARPMIRERGKVFPSASTLIKGRAGERVRTERENSSGALIKRNINQRDDMAMYEPLHLLLKRFLLPFERRPPPHSFPSEYRPELLRMWVFLYAVLHVRLDSRSPVAASSSRSGEHPFSSSPSNGRSSDNEEKHLGGWKCLKMRKWIYIDSCFSRFLLWTLLRAISSRQQTEIKSALLFGFWDNDDATQHMQTQCRFQLSEVFKPTFKCFVRSSPSPPSPRMESRKPQRENERRCINCGAWI